MNVDALPEWILTLVHQVSVSAKKCKCLAVCHQAPAHHTFIASVVCVQAQWTVGKLNCRKCSARLGGFDFIHYFECPCGQDAAIHLNKSRVDPEPNQCYPMAQPRMQKPAEAHRNLLMTESQRQDSEWNKAKLTCSHPNDATAISNSAVTSNSLSASENISLFSFSPLYCIRKRKPRRLEDSSAVQSSGCCSAAPVDKPSTRLTSADTDERLHASRAAAPRLDAAREASVIVSSLVPARRLSRARHLVQQPLEVDVSPAETSAVHEDVQRACPLSFPFVTEGEQQVRVCNLINDTCRCFFFFSYENITACFCAVGNSRCIVSLSQIRRLFPLHVCTLIDSSFFNYCVFFFCFVLVFFSPELRLKLLWALWPQANWARGRRTVWKAFGGNRGRRSDGWTVSWRRWIHFLFFWMLYIYIFFNAIFPLLYNIYFLYIGSLSVPLFTLSILSLSLSLFFLGRLSAGCFLFVSRLRLKVSSC